MLSGSSYTGGGFFVARDFSLCDAPKRRCRPHRNILALVVLNEAVTALMRKFQAPNRAATAVVTDEAATRRTAVVVTLWPRRHITLSPH